MIPPSMMRGGCYITRRKPGNTLMEEEQPTTKIDDGTMLSHFQRKDMMLQPTKFKFCF